LALPCNKAYEQCGGRDFKKNPCCQDGLECYGDQPEYYMQCTDHAEAKRKGDTSGALADDDDDDSGEIRLSALPVGIHKRQEPRARLAGCSILGIGLMVATGGVALAVQKQVCQRGASHQFLCTEDGVQEEPSQPTSLQS